jgi:hypothetical protein
MFGVRKVLLRIPHIFTHAEYADMVFVYGFCNGSGIAACREYRRRFPNRRVPDSRVFTTNCVRLVQFPAVRFLLNVQMNKMWMK